MFQNFNFFCMQQTCYKVDIIEFHSLERNFILFLFGLTKLSQKNSWCLFILLILYFKEICMLSQGHIFSLEFFHRSIFYSLRIIYFCELFQNYSNVQWIFICLSENDCFSKIQLKYVSLATHVTRIDFISNDCFIFIFSLSS